MLMPTMEHAYWFSSLTHITHRVCTTEIKYYVIPPDVNTRRYLDIDSMLFERYGRQMDVKTILCAYWAIDFFLKQIIIII